MERVGELLLLEKARLLLAAALVCCIALQAVPALAASWGTYNLIINKTIYGDGQNGALRTSWYGSNAGRVVLKASDDVMATMPDASLVTGSTFTIAFMRSGTYSSSLDAPVNIYKITKAWDTATVKWTVPWATGGGDFSGVGTGSQSVVYPAEATVYTFSPGAGYNFPYGVLFKSDNESSLSYRKAWYPSGPYPTLTVNYTPPAGTANGNIWTWAYLGHYAQGATADHVTRINTDHVAGTYGGVPVDETTIAPNIANGSTGTAYGNSYGTAQWKNGTGAADVVDLLGANFYNAATKENGTTYAAVYMYYTGTTTSQAYIGWGSDDDCKIYINGVLRGSFLGDGRGASQDNNFSGPFTLTNGTWYRVLLKVENGNGGYGLQLRFASANRKPLSGCTFYYKDGTAPSTPTSLACTGVSNGVWQNTDSTPTFTWTSGTDSQGSGEGVSTVRGQKYYFGTSSSAAPDTFMNGTSTTLGAVADGTYYFKVETIDYALNGSADATFTFRYDGTKPINPSASCTCNGGAVSSGTWTNLSTPTFTLSGASDATSGLKTPGANARYKYYFGTDSGGAPDTGTDSTDISPTVPGDGTYYLRVQTQDNAGNWSEPATVFEYKYDTTEPTASFTAKQDDADVKTGGELNDDPVTVQGEVVISVEADDLTAGLRDLNPVSVTIGEDPVTVTQSDGAFVGNYVIDENTQNGAHVITITATDKAGNAKTSTDWIYVNKNQISGTVTIQGLDAASRTSSITRDLTFRVNGGTPFTLPVTFPAGSGAVTYRLTRLSGHVTTLTVKSAWTLRRKFTGLSMVNGQLKSMDFELRAGDLNDSNSININDYAILKAHYFTSDPATDINGDGTVNTADYELMKLNWFGVGDPE